jgi:hypothetical protein
MLLLENRDLGSIVLDPKYGRFYDNPDALLTYGSRLTAEDDSENARFRRPAGAAASTITFSHSNAARARRARGNSNQVCLCT